MSTIHQPTYPLPSRVLDSLQFTRLHDLTPLGVQARHATVTLLERSIERPDGYWRDSHFRAGIRAAVRHTIYITDDIVCEYIVECRNEYGEESE